MHLLPAYLWTICILLSYIGWGFAVNRLLLGPLRVHWSLQAVWGLAFTVAVGGVLNLSGMVSSTTILPYVFCGMAWFVRGKMRHAKLDSAALARIKAVFIPDWYTAALWLVLLPCVAADVLVWTWYGDPNFADDLQSYFVYAERMVQAGSSGPDPFNTVLHLSSLGGHSFMEALLLPVASFRYLNLLDAGLGLVITLGLIHHAGGRAGLRTRQSVLLMLFVTILPLPHVSLTALRSGTAMLLGLALTAELLEAESRRGLKQSVLMALILSALCCLKTTLIASTGGFFLAFAGLRLRERRDWRGTALDMAATALLGALFLLPWMIAMYRSGGTFLFPVLGLGNHRFAFSSSFWSPFGDGDWVQTLLASQSDPLLVIAEVAGVAWLLGRPWRTPRNWPALALLAGALIGALAIASSANRYETGRYSFVADVAALAMLVCFAFRGSAASHGNDAVAPGIPGVRARPAAATALTLLLAAGIAFSRPWPPNLWQRLCKALPQLASSAAEDKRDVVRVGIVSRAQQSVPEGACILARLSWPSFLDFKRNTVWVVDRPGVFSPPPGMPLGDGPETLARYLANANGVSYVMYSYGDEANCGPKVTTPRIEAPARPWQRPEALATVAFHKDLRELPTCRKKIYDDGFFMVVDLHHSASE